MSAPDGELSSSPRLFPGAGGARMFSQAALMERVIEEFTSEYGASAPGNDALTSASRSDRLKLLRDVVDYVLARESVRLTLDERSALLRAVYGELFGYGPLDALLTNPEITSIVLAGDRHAAVRFGHGEMRRIEEPLFQDAAHLRAIIDRLLADAGAELDERDIVREVGLNIGGRPVRMSVATPPVTPVLYADFRLHAAHAPALTDLQAAGWMTEEVRAFIERIARSPHGIAIVGEPETGKTTLLNALLPFAAGQGTVLERAGELRPPSAARHIGPGLSPAPENAVTFGDWVAATVLDAGDYLAVDEVRGEEPEAVAPLLGPQEPPRQWWAVRGVPDAKRLQSSMGMLARRAAPDLGEDAVHALYARLPFTITLARIGGRLQVFSIAEWQSRVDSDYPDYVMLFRYSDGASRRTEAIPARWLD